jgi:hypothetical protein
MSSGFGTQFSFGSGYVYGIPLASSQSYTLTPQLTPVLLGTLQDCSYDISSTIKELYGQLQFAVAIGRGPAKFTGKTKVGSFSAEALNTFFFGPGSDGSALPQTVSLTGQLAQGVIEGSGQFIPSSIQVVNKEVGTASSSSYTFANTASGKMDTNLGVYYSATGNYLQEVTSNPGLGQYTFSQATGTWVFASSGTDPAANSAGGITVAYAWTPTTPTRILQAINNNAFPMGSAPTFEIVHNIPYSTGGTDTTLKIYSAISSKLSFGFKNSDFTVPDLDFTMFANASGRVMDLITYT